METADGSIFIHLAYATVLFVFGAAVGSFLNVVIHRAPLDMSLLDPPSSCPACGKRIAWRDNIPLFAWIALRGRCRRCSARISWRYPAIELLTAALWAVEGWRLAGYDHGTERNAAIGTLELLFISAMIAAAVIDCDWQIILDEVSLGGTAAALLAAPFLPELHAAETPVSFYERCRGLHGLVGGFPAWFRSLSAGVFGGLFGAAMMLALYFLGGAAMKKQIEKARRKNPDIDSAVGLGDVKLMACMGAFLGWKDAFLVLMIGAALAALVGSFAKLVSGDSGGESGAAGFARRWRSGDSVFPFGPFLAIGAFVALFLRDGAGP